MWVFPCKVKTEQKNNEKILNDNTWRKNLTELINEEFRDIHKSRPLLGGGGGKDFTKEDNGIKNIG